MAKVAVVGDLHIGASFSLSKPTSEERINSRLLDYKQTLDTTIDEIAAAGAKNLIFTGDLFESRNPPLTQQKIFSQALHRAFSKGIETISIVVGNHDQTRLTNTSTADPLKELRLPNLHVYDEICAVELKENGRIIANLITVPYRDRKWFGVDTPDEANAIIEKQVQAAAAGIKNECMKLAVPHVCFEGTTFESEDAEFYGDNQLFVPLRVFDGIDVVCGGHIHQHQILRETPHIAYVGSMEKRGAFESHDKVYALIDTEIRAAEYFKEPCREIYDIKLDYSHLVLGEALQERIFDDVAEFAERHDLKNSIVRLLLKITASDDAYVAPKQIYKMLKTNYDIHNCVEIHPELYSPRQARNDRITEQVGDRQAFKIYLETLFDDKEVLNEILEIGTEIIRDVEAQDAAS